MHCASRRARTSASTSTNWLSASARSRSSRSGDELHQSVEVHQAWPELAPVSSGIGCDEGRMAAQTTEALSCPARSGSRRLGRVNAIPRTRARAVAVDDASVACKAADLTNAANSSLTYGKLCAARDRGGSKALRSVAAGAPFRSRWLSTCHARVRTKRATKVDALAGFAPPCSGRATRSSPRQA